MFVVSGLVPYYSKKIQWDKSGIYFFKTFVVDACFLKADTAKLLSELSSMVVLLAETFTADEPF